MRIKFCFSALALVLYSATLLADSSTTGMGWLMKGVETAAYQLEQTAEKVRQMTDMEAFPRTIKDGKLKLVGPYDWTSGFFSGSLWYAYELTGDKKMAQDAREYTNKLEVLQFYKGIHDVGFMIFCSYGNAKRLAPEKSDSLVLINTAKSLSTRFSPKVGLICSWDHEAQWKFPVIIDNMMNLELLFEATKMTGDKSFQDIATSHADNTMKNHFRPDMSCYHLVSYDSETGAVKTKETHQGYSNESSWARGQGWAVYGYTVCYRYTKDRKYKDWAEKVANYIIANVKPVDAIPYWDYMAPNIPNAPRDASAAAVTASAMLELSQYASNGAVYFNYAEKILKSLSSKAYLAEKGQNQGFVLLHSVGSWPHNSEVDVPLNYADYYYLEAVKRYVSIKKIRL